MRNTWLARLNTLCLALLLAGGGSGLPVADAFFHHMRGTAEDGNRVADGESPATHGERCSLGVPLPAMASARAVAALPACVMPPLTPTVQPHVGTTPSTDLPPDARPRAPPRSIG